MKNIYYEDKYEKSQKSDNRKVQHKDKMINWKAVLNGLVSGAAIVSAIFTIITVGQMKADRIAAYRPSILINPAEYSFSWDVGGSWEWLDSSSRDEATPDDYESGTINIPVNIIMKDAEQFSAVNVGVGSAKQVSFKWSESNIESLNEYLIQCDESKRGFLDFKESVVFDYYGTLVGMGLPSNTSLMYMLPEATEIYDIPLPTVYYVLIQEIIKSGGEASDIPYLILTVNYSDIQEKDYSDNFVIQTKLILYSEESTGKGNATIQLIPLFKK